MRHERFRRLERRAAVVEIADSLTAEHVSLAGKSGPSALQSRTDLKLLKELVACKLLLTVVLATRESIFHAITFFAWPRTSYQSVQQKIIHFCSSI